MKQLGKKFKQKREEMDISLTKAREDTNIRLDYLKAIEQGEFDRVQEEVYLKGFLKIYSNYLNLNTQEIMEEYRKIKAAEEKKAVEEAKAEEEKREVALEELSFKERLIKFKEAHENLLLAAFIGGLILLLAAGGFYLGTVAYSQFRKYNVGEKIGQYITEVKSSFKKEEETDSESQTEGENISQTDASELKEESQQIAGKDKEEINQEQNQNQDQASRQNKDQELEADENEQGQILDNEQNDNNITEPENNKTSNAQPSASSSQEKTLIKIETIQESWYSVEIDGESVFKGVVSRGVTKSFSGEEIRVKIGNAAGIQIIKDEKTFGPFGEKGEVVTRVFSSQDEPREE